MFSNYCSDYCRCMFQYPQEPNRTKTNISSQFQNGTQLDTRQRRCCYREQRTRRRRHHQHDYKHDYKHRYTIHPGHTGPPEETASTPTANASAAPPSRWPCRCGCRCLSRLPYCPASSTRSGARRSSLPTKLAGIQKCQPGSHRRSRPSYCVAPVYHPV